MKIMFIGDIIGEPGRKVLIKYLPEILQTYNIDFVIANAENIAGGRGITKNVVEQVLSCGVNVLTSGNHIWDRKEGISVIDLPNILRPANYPQGVPGKGFGIYEVNNRKICVINLMGRVYMPLVDCPFQVVDKILEQVKDVKIKVVDFHAEITSEKQSMGWYLSGKVSAVIGSHTHIQTADERILPNGTAYITDCGMVGAYNSIIGIEKEIVIKKYLTAMPCRFYPAKGEMVFNSVVVEIDETSGKAEKIERLNKIFS